MRRELSGILLACAALLTGCESALPVGLISETGGAAALVGQFRAYDCASGTALNFNDVLRRSAAADVVLFGEEHSNSVCNQFQAQLFAALAATPRPVTLAMEFFEADTQAALDAYLARRIAEEDFRKQTRQNQAYVLAHRPLVEFCRARSIPVLAANAPRRLVRAYRLSDQTFADFRAAQSAEEQRWLPRSSEIIYGPYFTRFSRIMGDDEKPAATAPATAAAAPTAPTTAPLGTSAPATQAAAEASARESVSFAVVATPAGAVTPTSAATVVDEHAGADENVRRTYRSQLLWDDAMAESVADERARRPERRVLLIVGRFHVEEAGMLYTKYRQRRPDDRILRIIWRSTTALSFNFSAEDAAAGDIVIFGPKPAKRE